jgi:hypothetical protein
MGAPALPPVVSLLAIKGRRLKRIAARNAQVVFSHLHPNALECRACSATARSAIVRVHRRRCTATRHLACCLNRYDVLRIFRRPEGRSKGARRKRLRRRLSNGGGQTRLGEVLCALDDHGGVNRTLPKCGRGYDRQGGGARGEMQKLSAAKFYRGRSLSALSLDHLVGACEHGRRNLDADHLGDLDVDHQRESGWLFNW